MELSSSSVQIPHLNRRQRRLSLPKKAGRFAAPTKPSDLQKVCEGFVPKATQRCTNWGVRVFEACRNDHNKACVEKCPDDFIETHSLPALNKWLSAFVVEAWHEYGERYPTTTITNLLSGLWRFACNKSSDYPNFMDRRDRCFADLNGAISSIFHKLREDGIGAVVKHAPVVTPQEEDLLWSTGAIGTSSPLSLQQAIFYYVGKVLFERERRAKMA